MSRLGVIAIVSLPLGLVACGGGGTPPPVPGEVTFWQDVAPIYNAKCVRCHQEGGIAPFRLDNYADAKDHAALERRASWRARCRPTSWSTTAAASRSRTTSR